MGIMAENRGEFFGQIIDIFEDFLAGKGIVISNDEREEEQNEALIFGSAYDNIRDKLEQVLKNWDALEQNITVSTEHRSDFLVQIADVLENFLSDRGIDVPCGDKEGTEGEAVLYGDDYFQIEDSLRRQFENWGILKPEHEDTDMAKMFKTVQEAENYDFFRIEDKNGVKRIIFEGYVYNSECEGHDVNGNSRPDYTYRILQYYGAEASLSDFLETENAYGSLTESCEKMLQDTDENGALHAANWWFGIGVTVRLCNKISAELPNGNYCVMNA